MLSRPQLQQLAKQHGIKANMKSIDIEAALKELGVALIAPAEDKPIKRVTGLFVRDMNEMEDCALPAAKKPAIKQKPTRKSVNLYFDEDAENNVENRNNNNNKPAPRKSLSVEIPQYRVATRRSTEKLLLEQQRASALALQAKEEEDDETEELTKQANEAAQQEVEQAAALLAQRQAEEAAAAQQEAKAAAQQKEAATLLQQRLAAKRQAYGRLVDTLNKVHAAYLKQTRLLLIRELIHKQRATTTTVI